METRDAFLNKIEEYKKKFTDQNNVPDQIIGQVFAFTNKIEFWKDVEKRMHQRLEIQERQILGKNKFYILKNFFLKKM